MNSRTCLLCGKALSRTAGSGQDFCSYEHRSQYRLHRGLERLNETVRPSALGHRVEFRALARPCAADAGEPRLPDTRQIRNTSRLTDSYIQPLRSDRPHVQKPDWHSHIQSREVIRVAFPAAPPAARPREFQILR